MRRRSEVNEGLARVKTLETDRNVVGLIHELDSEVRGRTRYSIVRDHAATALGRLGDPRAIPYLVKRADDPEPMVRIGVLVALGRLHASEAQEVLIAGLTDPSSVVRMAAVEALGRLGDPAVLPRLWEVLDQDQDAETRLQAAEAIALLGDQNVASRIPGALSDVSWRVRGHPRRRRLKEFADTGKPLEPWDTPW
jgi:HEAT repeat protein